jgi:hypothetical protein
MSIVSFPCIHILESPCKYVYDYPKVMCQPHHSPHDDHSLKQMKMQMQQTFLCYPMMLRDPCLCFPQLSASVECGADFAGPA